MPTDILVVEAREMGMRDGASILSNLTGGQSVDRCQLVARVYRPGGVNAIIAWQDFNRWGTEPIEALSGLNRQNAQEALDRLIAEIQDSPADWEHIRAGSAWYSHRFEVQYELGSLYDDDMTALIARMQAHGRAAVRKRAKRGSIAGRIAKWSALVFISGIAIQILGRVIFGDPEPYEVRYILTLVSLSSCLSVMISVPS